MLNSLFLMFSQYVKNRKISNIFKIIWIIYTIVVSYFNFNLAFFTINLSAFILVTGLSYGINKLNTKANMIFSVFSILVYSFTIDIICYFAFPMWVQNISLIGYITNGFLFNLKYIAANAGIIAIVKLVSKILSKYKVQNVKLACKAQ